MIVLYPKTFTNVRLHEKRVSLFQGYDYNTSEGPPRQDGRTNIKDVAPEARTLYHELFYLY